MVEAEDTEAGGSYHIKDVLWSMTVAFTDQHNDRSGVVTDHKHLFSKGVHYSYPNSLKENVLAFADDGRLFFAIPMANRTCIGTTDTLVENPITEVTDEDRDFILSNINARLEQSKPLTREDIISNVVAFDRWQYPTNRNRFGFSAALRKHVIETDREQRHLSIFGGKLRLH